MLKFKMKIYLYNGIHDVNIGVTGNILINPGFTVSHSDDVKWYIFINIHITILEIYMYDSVMINLNIMHPNMYF